MNFLDTFNVVDVVITVVLLLGLFTGLRRGLSGELARVISAALAVYAAWRLAEPVARLISERQAIQQEQAYLGSFLTILAISLVLMWIVRIALRSVLVFAFKGKIERVGGALCGLIRGAVIVAVLVLMISFAPSGEVRNKVIEESVLGHYLCERLRPVYQDLQERVPQLNLPGTTPETTPEENQFIITDEEESPPPWAAEETAP